MTEESEVQKQILEYLQKKGITAWRNNTGDFRRGGRYIRCGIKGSSDIIGIISPCGTFLAIEVKSAKGVVSPEQRDFLNTIHREGGLSIVARSLDDVMKRI